MWGFLKVAGGNIGFCFQVILSWISDISLRPWRWWKIFHKLDELISLIGSVAFCVHTKEREHYGRFSGKEGTSRLNLFKAWWVVVCLAVPIRRVNSPWMVVAEVKIAVLRRQAPESAMVEAQNAVYKVSFGVAYATQRTPCPVRNLFFQDTARTDLEFSSTYPGLQDQAGAKQRSIPLGFGQLRQPRRLKVIQQQLGALAPVVEGGADKTLDHPKDLDSMIEFQNGWTQLSKAIQNANRMEPLKPIVCMASMARIRRRSQDFIMICTVPPTQGTAPSLLSYTLELLVCMMNKGRGGDCIGYSKHANVFHGGADEEVFLVKMLATTRGGLCGCTAVLRSFSEEFLPYFHQQLGVMKSAYGPSTLFGLVVVLGEDVAELIAFLTTLEIFEFGSMTLELVADLCGGCRLVKAIVKVQFLHVTKKCNTRLSVAVLLACWAATVEPVPPPSPPRPIYKASFTVTDATKSKYDVFIKDVLNAVKVHGSVVQGIPVLPSSKVMPPTDLHRYVMVELFAKDNKGKVQNVSLVIDATDLYLKGYRPGLGTKSYFFKSTPQNVRNLFFPGTTRVSLSFDGDYDSLEGQAGAHRDQIPLGFGELKQKIENINRYEPKGAANTKKVAEALIVCIEMVSEATRYKVIQQQIAALAPLVPGSSDRKLYPDALMQAYETNWGQLSTAVQSAKLDGAFFKSVTVAYLTYSNVASLRPIIAQSPQLLPSCLGDDGETCEVVLAPTSYITGRNFWKKCMELSWL
ncbi:hypothetical protein GQ457_18G025670 [Hibiscus cannabinus]